jgi:hypothetical protein
MAFLTFAITSGGMVFMPCASLACLAILVMSSASVGALALKEQAMPVSLHLNDGIFLTSFLSFLTKLALYKMAAQSILNRYSSNSHKIEPEKIAKL